MANTQGRKSGGDRKHDRNKKKCDIYRRMGKHELSHIRRIQKHMKKYKDSSQATKNALKKYKDLYKT